MLRDIGKSDYKQICSWSKRYKYDYFNNQLKNVGNTPVMEYKTIFDKPVDLKKATALTLETLKKAKKEYEDEKNS